MNKTILNHSGLIQLKVQEQQKTNGGYWQIVVAYVLVEAMLNPQSHFDSFMHGYNEVNF